MQLQLKFKIKQLFSGGFLSNFGHETKSSYQRILESGVSHKYGINIPCTINEVYALDYKDNNIFWRSAIHKEMENLKVAFDILPHGKDVPPGYKPSSGHLVFDVRMTLERKARWVKDDHKTPEPELCTFAGVVSRKSVRNALTYASLNGLDVCACDIQNSHLQAPSSEKYKIICGPEIGLQNVGIGLSMAESVLGLIIFVMCVRLWMNLTSLVVKRILIF